MNLQIETDESGRKYISDGNSYHVPIPKNATFTEEQLSAMFNKHTVEVLSADTEDALEYIGYKIMYVEDFSNYPVLVQVYKAVFPKKGGVLCGTKNAYITETDFSEYEGCGIHYSFGSFALDREKWNVEMCWDEEGVVCFPEYVSPLMNPDAIASLIIDGYAEDAGYRCNFDCVKEELEERGYYNGREYDVSDIEAVIDDRGFSVVAHDMKLVPNTENKQYAVNSHSMKVVTVYKKYNENFELIEVDEDGNEIIVPDNEEVPDEKVFDKEIPDDGVPL